MNLQEGIEKLKELLFSKEVETKEYKFETAKLNDGVTILEWDGELATGAVVMIVGEAGKLPAPIGVYTLEDGTTFEVVNDNGTIDNVVKAGEEVKEEAPEVAPEMSNTSNAAPAQPAAASPKRVIKSQVEEHVFHLEIEGVEPIAVDFSSMFNILNEKFDAVKKENEDLKGQLDASEKLNKEVFKVVKQMADEPLTAPTESRKESFSIIENRKAFKADLAKITKKLNDNQ